MTTAPPLRSRRARALPLGVALAAALVYANALTNGYALDDVYIILQNERVHRLLAFGDIWLTPYWPTEGALLGLYRPLAIAAYSLQWALADGAAWIFHTVNLLLHAAISVLVYLLARHFATPRAAAAGALVFAVHPVHTEAVANVVGQAELLAAAAMLGAVLLHLGRAQLRPSLRRTIALCLLFALALLAKESAITLPALLVLMDFAQRRVTLQRDSLRQYARSLALPALLLAATAGVYLLLRSSVLGSLTGSDPAAAYPYLHERFRLLHAFRAWPEYLRLLLFPLDLASDYGPAVVLPVDAFTPPVALGALILLAVAALAALVPRYPRAGLPAAWFLISILTVSNLFFTVGVLIAERTLYLPSVALALALALALDALLRGDPRPARLGVVAVGIAALLLAARTVMRNPDWKNTAAVAAALVRDHPESYRSQWILADHWQRQGDVARAEVHWLLAYRLWPRDSQFLYEYAGFHLGQQNHARGIQLLEEARQLHPRLARTHERLAFAYLAVQRNQEGLAAAERALSLGSSAALSSVRTEALYRLGRFDDAAAAATAATREVRNQRWHPWAQRARALASGGHASEAVFAADSALALAPDNAAVRGALEELRAAAASGCLARRECADPLSRWVRSARRTPADSARMLQNATLVSPRGGAADSSRNR